MDTPPAHPSSDMQPQPQPPSSPHPEAPIDVFSFDDAARALHDMGQCLLNDEDPSDFELTAHADKPAGTVTMTGVPARAQHLISLLFDMDASLDPFQTVDMVVALQCMIVPTVPGAPVVTIKCKSITHLARGLRDGALGDHRVVPIKNRIGLVINFCTLFGSHDEFRDEQLYRSIRSSYRLTLILLGVYDPPALPTKHTEDQYVAILGCYLVMVSMVESMNKHIEITKKEIARGVANLQPALGFIKRPYASIEDYDQRVSFIYSLAKARVGYVEAQTMMVNAKIRTERDMEQTHDCLRKMEGRYVGRFVEDRFVGRFVEVEMGGHIEEDEE